MKCILLMDMCKHTVLKADNSPLMHDHSSSLQSASIVKHCAPAAKYWASKMCTSAAVYEHACCTCNSSSMFWLQSRPCHWWHFEAYARPGECCIKRSLAPCIHSWWRDVLNANNHHASFVMELEIMQSGCTCKKSITSLDANQVLIDVA